MILLAEMIGSGTGLYTLKEAAKYAKISPTTLKRWLAGSDAGKRVFTFENAKVITFPEFVQVLAAQNLRVTHKIPLQKIRAAVNNAKKEFGIAYPLAVKHTTWLFDKELWIKPSVVSEYLVQASGKTHGQKGLQQLMKPDMIGVSFDKETGLANRYRAFQKGAHKIVMNPKVRFGEPLLEGCGYTPEALYEAFKTEGSVEMAARSYGVTPSQVEVCVDYFNYLLAA